MVCPPAAAPTPAVVAVLKAPIEVVKVPVPEPGNHLVTRRAIIRTFDAMQLEVATAIKSMHTPDKIEHLTMLDDHAGTAIEPLRHVMEPVTQYQVDEAVKTMLALRDYLSQNRL